MCKGLLAALVLLAAACGGGDDSASTSPESEVSDKRPAKRAYLARGDAICADAQANLARLQPKIEKARAASGDEQIELAAEIWREQIRILDSFSSELKALGTPPGDEARIREFVRSLDEGERLGREITSHIEDGEEPPQPLMNDYAQAAYRGNALARAYGFKVCGKESG
jgi:hypothetical protein